MPWLQEPVSLVFFYVVQELTTTTFGCRHLIADHIGWFKESTEEGKLKTVEDLLRARGEKVRRGRLDAGGVVEYVE